MIDTGGLDDRGAVSFAIQSQVEHAMKTADVILFMLDSKVGVTSVDEYFASWLRRKLVTPKNKNLPNLSEIDSLPISLGGSDKIRIRSAKDIILIGNTLIFY